MTIELKVPSAGESITEVTIVEWLKGEGDAAQVDETIAVIETDKANVDVVAPVGGTITKIVMGEGAVAEVGQVIGYMEEGAAASAPKAEAKPEPEAEAKPEPKAEAKPEPKAEAKPEPKAEAKPEPKAEAPPPPSGRLEPIATPSARRALREAKLEPGAVAASGTIRAEDVRRIQHAVPAREEERVAMTPLRRRIAERLVSAQQTAALLTTFNEVDMTEIIELRKRYQDAFVKKYDMKLGFMSFFVKAVVEGLKAFPAINAEIDGDSIVYRNYYDIGVAVGGGRGLVVPVLRNAERLSFAEVELQINDFGVRAKKNRLKVEELQGGTFTISNGGVYGSLLSTPIINPPQSGILGMHAIQERPAVVNGQVVPRKMMYVALTYDHRVVDGREAVSFLVRVKECIEEPSRILLEI